MDKMHDLGEKGDPPMQAKSNKVSYPSLYLEAKQLPGLKDLEVGEEVMLHFKARVRSKDETEQVGRPERCSLSLELKAGSLEKMESDEE